MRLPRLLVLFSIVVALGAVGPSAVAQQSTTDVGGSTTVDDEVRLLAERHVPRLVLRAQDAACDETGEPFVPVPVEVVLDNPQIALRQVGSGDPVVKWGPTARDLFGLGEGFYLDFPGSTLEPGCIYERDQDRYLDGLEPTVYAHLVTQADRPGFIALQYWFYWYFNDWNNKHESDWEGIQLLFEADSVAEALRTDPVSVGYAQHAGGHREDWDSDGLERIGDRPVVYSSARSHASYFSSSLFLGRGASEGFGCDNTLGPSTVVDPAVVVLPSTVDDADDPLAWLGFDGRWGERQKGPFNAPTGLRQKGRWTEPVTWHEGLRDASVAVPAGDSIATSVIDGFCGVVEWGSGQLIQFALSPTRLLLTAGVLAAGLVWLIRRTDWRPIAALPVQRRRRAGQILRGSWSMYRRRWRQFLAIGLLSLPITFLAGMAVGILRLVPLLDDIVDLADTGSGSRAVLSAATTGVAGSVSFALVVAAVTAATRRLEVAGADGGGLVSLAEVLADVRARARDLVTALARVIVPVVALGATVVGAPLAYYLAVRWQLVTPAVMAGVDGRAAARESARLTGGRWWHTAVVTGVIGLAVVAGGFVVALVVLVAVTSMPLWTLTIVSGAVNVVVMPLGAIALVLLHGDAVAEHGDAVAERLDEIAVDHQVW